MTAEPGELVYGLSRLQRDCLLIVQELTALGEGVAPSLGEIQRELDASSRSTVHRLLLVLRDKGFIVWLPYRWRSIVVRRPIPMPAEPKIVGLFEAPGLAREAVSP